MPNNTDLPEDIQEALASRTHPLEVRPSQLPWGAFEAYMEVYGYGGPDPQYSAQCRATALEDPDSDWDSVHGVFMYVPDGTLLAWTEDAREEPLAWTWEGNRWHQQSKTVAWLARSADLSE